MRRLALALAALVATAIAVPLVVVNTGDEPVGPRIVSGTCTPVLRGLDTPSGDPGQRYWDPILFPGSPGFPFPPIEGEPRFNAAFHGPAHWHTFFGNESLRPDGITDPAAPTSCGAFNGNFWTPSLIVRANTEDNIRVDPASISYEFRYGPRAVIPPLGLGIIVRAAKWDCGPGTPQTNEPKACAGDKASVTLKFPRFWDGENLHLPGEAHVSFTNVAGWVRLPKISVRVDFDLRFAGELGALSVNGLPMPPQSVDYPILPEDERSFHMDVLFTGEPVT